MKPNTKRRNLLGGMLAGGLLQGCGGGGASAGAGPADVPIAGAPDIPPPQDGPGVQAVPASGLPIPSLLALDGRPLYIAHRGAAALYPEETYTAYDGCVRDGQLFLEGDVFTLSDGTTVVMHDETVDRTTGESGPVAAYTRAKWNNLRVDADNWHRSRYGNRLAAVQFTAWVNRYKQSSLLVPEDKDGRSMSAMLATLASEGVPKHQVLIQSFRLSALQQARDAGYSTCALVTAGGPQPALAVGATWGGIPVIMSAAETRAWTESGINVLVWTVNRRYQRDAKLQLGVKGFFSDDPVYLGGNLPLFTTDRFEAATWMPGMLPNSGELISAVRGKFMEGGYWGYDETTTPYQGCLQGYLCPIKGQARPTSYSVELNIRFGAIANSDPTRWASVYIGTDDREFIDSDEECAGYQFLFRRNGSVEIFKKVPGKSGTLLSAKSGPSLSEGEEARFRIRVEGASLSVSRLAADGSESYGSKTTDETYRGAYISLGRNGLACAFRRVVVS